MARRIIPVVVLVGVAVVAFLLLRPDGGDDELANVPAPTATTGTATPTATAAEPVTGTEPATVPAPVASYRLEVQAGEPVGGVTRITVRRGQQLRLTVTGDGPEEVHVHGYDLQQPVDAGSPARFAFAARFEGVFEIELHGSARQIGELRVTP
jgi:hypothetical protein